MDKQIGKYLRRVRRHLELPKNMKDRVMEDLVSSIQSRRDAGKTDSQIMEELGSPKAAAAVLNEQMKDYTFRKSPWRFLFGAVAVYGAARLLGSLLSRIAAFFIGVSIAVGESSTVGIIGGADGPTAIFVTSPRWTGLAVSFGAMAIGIVGFVLLRRLKRK